jgi:leader peptidase (prepilin peptidase)/N-methyltransferase
MIIYLFYLIFLAALAATAITDYLYLQIHRAATIFLIPLFAIGAYFCLTPVTLIESLLGVLVGYGFLWLFMKAYRAYRGFDGLGQGDLELLAMIGSFLGPMAVFFTITLGSMLGTVVALVLMLLKKAHAQTALPFGTFLVFGCFAYIFLGYL